MNSSAHENDKVILELMHVNMLQNVEPMHISATGPDEAAKSVNIIIPTLSWMPWKTIRLICCRGIGVDVPVGRHERAHEVELSLLRGKLQRSPLMDHAGYAREFTEALEGLITA